MESHTTDAVAAELQRATGILQKALSEACAAEVTSASTGELLRVEEVLAIAGDAAHQAVTLRRRGKRKPPRPSAPVEADLPVTHREFADEAGVSWDAFAVYPSAEATGRARLPEPYCFGWLSFDSGAERRRLSPIPEGWQEATTEALARMCARAEPAPRRSTPERPGPQQSQ